MVFCMLICSFTQDYNLFFRSRFFEYYVRIGALKIVDMIWDALYTIKGYKKDYNRVEI